MRIVFKNQDGSCGVIIPAADWEGTLEELAEKDVPEGLSWRLCNLEDIPSDRAFRDAWTDDNLTNTVDVDMVKARDIHMGRIRDARDMKLKELDVETMRGLDVQAQKQLLRDIPQNLDLTTATTPDELKSIWHEEL